MISSIQNFPSISSLETLSITNNNINDLTTFINSARTKYPQLKSLNTFKNPMNPGMGQPQAYNQYKSYMKQIGRITELDGMNINDTSFMNQQQQPKRDLFGTSTGSQPKRDLFGTTSTTTKVNFFDTTPANNNISQSTNMAMNNNQNNTASYTSNNMFASTNPTVTYNTPQTTQSKPKPKMSMFDSVAPAQTNMSNMFANTNSNADGGKMVVSSDIYGTGSGASTSGHVFKRQFFVIDESAEIDGSEFVNSKKKKSLIMVNEKILKKSDNMTKFNRKNKSEGNKHILNSEL
jgi:hypothetical protein